MSKFIHLCDCGRVAYKKDGSGWFCRECELFVKEISALIEKRIYDRMHEENGNYGHTHDLIRKNNRTYRNKNREQINKAERERRKCLIIQAHKLSNSLALAAV